MNAGSLSNTFLSNGHRVMFFWVIFAKQNEHIVCPHDNTFGTFVIASKRELHISQRRSILIMFEFDLWIGDDEEFEEGFVICSEEDEDEE
jgi:hypothetical protein